ASPIATKIKATASTINQEKNLPWPEESAPPSGGSKTGLVCEVSEEKSSFSSGLSPTGSVLGIVAAISGSGVLDSGVSGSLCFATGALASSSAAFFAGDVDLFFSFFLLRFAASGLRRTGGFSSLSLIIYPHFQSWLLQEPSRSAPALPRFE